MPEKYQDEIEEILKGIEEKGPIIPVRKSEQPVRAGYETAAPEVRTDRAVRASGRQLPSISPSKLAVAGIICILLGWLWLNLFIWVGLGLLAGSYLMAFVRPRSINMEKRWRGQPLDERCSPWQRFKRWLQN
jgi:hypothetical protein